MLYNAYFVAKANFEDPSSEVHSNASIKEKEIYCMTESSVSLVLLLDSVFDVPIHVVPEAQVGKNHNMIPNRPRPLCAWAPQSLVFAFII